MGCLNVRGIETSIDLVYKLLDTLDLLAISDHWLHSYNLNFLSSIHDDFCVLSSSSVEEDVITCTCTPRYIRGISGVALFWHKDMNNCQKAY